jgi:tetratricopeptide (TPR) repeat protein
MEQSALEFYQKAYNLHYKERRIDDAVEVYERIIRKFPDANASAYAAVQLQKIQANKTVDELRLGRRGLSLPVRLLFVGQTLLLVAAVLYSFSLDRQMRNRSAYQSALTLAVGKIAVGNDSEALDICGRLKMLAHNDITPFALGAEIYQKRRDFSGAKNELEQYQTIVPDDPLVSAMLLQVARSQKAARASIPASPPVVAVLPDSQASAAASVITPQPDRPLPRTSAEREIVRKPDIRRKPNRILIPDSVTFF